TAVSAGLMEEESGVMIVVADHESRVEKGGKFVAHFENKIAWTSAIGCGFDGSRFGRNPRSEPCGAALGPLSRLSVCRIPDSLWASVAACVDVSRSQAPVGPCSTCHLRFCCLLDRAKSNRKLIVLRKRTAGTQGGRVAAASGSAAYRCGLGCVFAQSSAPCRVVTQTSPPWCWAASQAISSRCAVSDTCR